MKSLRTLDLISALQGIKQSSRGKFKTFEEEKDTMQSNSYEGFSFLSGKLSLVKSKYASVNVTNNVFNWEKNDLRKIFSKYKMKSIRHWHLNL